MFFKILLSMIAAGSAVFVGMQNDALVQIKVFSADFSAPVSAVISFFLGMGFVIGLIWRVVPHFHKDKHQVALIRSDMRVSR